MHPAVIAVIALLSLAGICAVVAAFLTMGRLFAKAVEDLRKGRKP